MLRKQKSEQTKQFDSVSRKILILLISCGLLPAITFADNSREVISVYGMSFECPRCSVRTAPGCEVLFDGTSKPIDCDSAVKELLGKALNKSAETDLPSVSEVRKYLLTTTPADAPTELALRYLLKFESGRRALIQDAYTFSEKYSAALAAIVPSTVSASDVWLAFWKLPSEEGTDLDSSLRAAIIANIRELDAKDLFMDLSIVDPQKDIEQLDVYYSALAANRQDLAQLLKLTKSKLIACSTVEQPAAECTAAKLSSLPPEAANYLQRVQMHRLIDDARGGKLDFNEIFPRLRATNYKEFRTPETHEMVLNALRSAKNAQFTERERLLDPTNRAVLSTFAHNDKLIAQQLIAVICRHAQDLWTEQNTQRTLELLSWSFRIDSDPSEERIRLFQEISDSPLWNEDKELQKQFKDVVESAKKGRGVTKFTKILLLSLSGFTGLFFVYIYFVLKTKPSAAEEAEIEAEIIAAAEASELEKLLEYFGIAENPVQSALTRSYRKKAKETHPDAGGGRKEQFQDLTASYRRATELLRRLGKDQEDEAADTDAD